MRVPKNGVGVVVLCQAPPVWGQRLPRHGWLSHEGRATARRTSLRADTNTDTATFELDGVPVRPRGVDVGGLVDCGNQFNDVRSPSVFVQVDIRAANADVHGVWRESQAGSALVDSDAGQCRLHRHFAYHWCLNLLECYKLHKNSSVR